MLRSILTFCIYLVCLFTANAQNPAALKRNGEKAFDDKRWEEAKTLLQQYQTAKPGDFGVLTKLGIAHYHLGQGSEARRYLEYVAAKSGSKDPDLLFYLARTLHGLSEWDRAIVAYKSFLRAAGERHPLRANAADQIRRCVSGMGIGANDQFALVESLGAQVNSAGDEFAPLPSLNHAGRLYYAAARKGCNGGKRNDEGYEDAERGHWCSDMFAARLSNSGWEGAGSLGGLLNTSRFEIPLGFNANGQVLYFFRGHTTFSGGFFADTAAKKDEYALEPPPFSSTMEPAEGDCNPYFFNEKTIIFASRRAGGYGGLDLWFTTFADTAWSQPVNLGPTINSAYDENTPFLARDGRTLYFSSNRPESMGGLDIYSSVFEDSKLNWQPPLNLGTPVNSPDDDAFFRVSVDGNTAFFASDRLGGAGERDLYIAYFKEPLPAQTTPGTPALFSEVGQNRSREPLENKFALPAMLYETDRDVVSADNLKIIQEAARISSRYPEVNVQVTVFTAETTQPKFDLYYGIKRAEVIGKALTDRGVAAGRINLKSVGAAYPLARSIVDGAPNPQAANINQRSEITFTSIEPLNFEFELQRPQVGESSAAGGVGLFDQQNKGLAFRVEAATTRQILANDAIAMFSDIVIESQPGSGAYKYTVGYFQQYEKALQLLKELQNAGFAEARVRAYVNNIPVSKAEAVSLLKKYPGLAAYIKG